MLKHDGYDVYILRDKDIFISFSVQRAHLDNPIAGLPAGICI